jgi:(2Fe-2S) ferredoxin
MYVELDAATARRVVLEHVRDGQPVLAQLHRRQRRKLERRLARAKAELDES